ncbi:MAG: carbohydrate-binding domain-containing protein [Clostridia bacterium]|nr:carbohydrate-binding domain-containing protein [Clostridia bacterium]
MKAFKATVMALVILLSFTACSKPPVDTSSSIPVGATEIVLSDSGITTDNTTVSNNPADAVYTANDIIYYESGKDFTYGEGSEKDAHSAEEASEHTVVHITKAGTYVLSGTLTKGQIAVDLGEDAKNNPEATVTLILNGAEISCSVAPAVIFYNVYECAGEEATKDVDTSAAGANVIIEDGTVNTVNGSYVERIYKPETVVLNDDNTEVEDAEKLHKYDGAFYSKMTMNVSGGKQGTGVLNINAENEGMDSEMHLTVNSGNINIKSGNDGINTNEDGVSVTTINGGKLTIEVTGTTGEGDGIDSNGWLVINGGTVKAYACSDSADAGIDSDMGIHINGGTVIASGHMIDRFADGGQNYAVFNFAQKQTGNETVILKDQNEKTVFEETPVNSYSVLIFSSPELKEGTYTLFSNGIQLAGQSGNMFGRPQMPEGMTPPEMIEGNQPPMPEGETHPQGFKPPEEPSEGFEPPEKPDDMTPPEHPDRIPKDKPDDNNEGSVELTDEFVVKNGGNVFGSISESE